MSKLSRRTALSVLGLAPVGTISAEAASREIHGANLTMNFSVENGRRMSAALRAMAYDIDAGGTFVESFSMASTAAIDDFLKHELKIKFALATQMPAKVQS